MINYSAPTAVVRNIKTLTGCARIFSECFAEFS